MVGEQAGRAASGFIEALKDQPLVLALVVVSFSLIGLLYYQSALFNTQRQENVRLFLEVQKEVQKLLSQCIVPPPQQFRPGSGIPMDLGEKPHDIKAPQ